MRSFLRHQLLPAFALLVALTVVTGVAYPAAVTAVAQAVFPAQANGSMIVVAGKTVGSALIGQSFSDPKYLWGRPSAAGVTDSNPGGYDANASAGSNLGPTNQALIERVTAAVDKLRAENGNAPVPVDLVTTSGSGLDPEISPAAAEYQVARIAAARGIGEADVRTVVARHTEQPLLGLLGQPRVNVLLVNLDLDGLLR
ncbi:MAG TPA: potassium-transporting ATPase subunit KdpC [Candidatus Nanopelagicales bacterium]|nr:potassium-transporting ATPase subunit KdpC [Candidatus Nanopelagicales bacterium]